MKHRFDKRIIWVGMVSFVAVALFVFLVGVSREAEEDASAASLKDFDPGYIISDYQMGNYNSMTEAEIQKFLTAKNPCNNTDYSYYKQLSAGSSYTWHFENGHFVCLSEEKFGDGEVIGKGDTAAHIIWQAAQDYKINPQVLIVLLQKETGLITDPIPNNGDYRKATGYGCPDTAACSSKYYGFKNQVRHAAALFRAVLDGGWTNYPLGNNYIQYNPSASCGGSTVNIRNLATSALYRYTPYQPNAAALAAGYGTAYCGAYGNRNFYLYFQDWFGGITDEDRRTYGKVLEDGDYILYSKANKQAALNVDENNMNVDVETLKNSGLQEWQLEYDEDNRIYTLKNKATGKVLDVEGAGTTMKTNVHVYRSNGTCAQQWRIGKNDDGSFSLFSVCSGMALDVAGGVAKSGDNVNMYRSNSTDAQKWIIVKKAEAEKVVTELADGLYEITPKCNQKVAIDISGGAEGALDATNIHVYKSNGTNAQKWKFSKNSDGTYSISNVTANKMIDVAGAGTTDKSNINVYHTNGTCAQKWYLEKDTDGYYTITSACSKLVIDVAGGQGNSGDNVNLYHANGTNAQKWKLTKIGS